MNATSGQISLPHGFWVNGTHCRHAELRTLTGADEEFLGQASKTMLPAMRSGQLLLRCLTALEGVERITPEIVGELTIGDREALLLHLRRLTFGDQMQAVLNCPHPDCEEPMDLDLRISDLLQPASQEPRQEYHHLVQHNGENVHIRFRLPTASDQELAGRGALADVAVAAEQLLRRCVQSVTDDRGQPMSWSVEMLDGLPGRMAELDPQAEMTLDMTCPVCGLPFSAILDAGDYLFKEVGQDRRRLYREIHLLALHYHWSEAEIMGMSTSKRRHYLQLLLESLPEV